MKKNATFNGLSAEETFKKLSANFNKDAIKTRYFDGIKYIEASDIRARLDEVFGKYGYSEEYPEIRKEREGSCSCFIAKCKVTVYDDEGNAAIIKEMWGGSEIHFPNIEIDGEKVKSKDCDAQANTVTSACVDAFKKLCKTCFGIGEADLANAKNGASYDVTLTGNLREFKGHYFGDCTNADGEVLKLALFSKQVSGCGLTLDELKALKRGDNITVQGDLGEDNKGNAQITIKKLSKVAASVAPTPTPKAPTPAPTPKASAPAPTPTPSNPTPEQKKMGVQMTITSAPTKLTSQPGMRFDCQVGDEVGRAIFLQPNIEIIQECSPEIWDTMDIGSTFTALCERSDTSTIKQWIVKGVA